jgi:hypothetical protein
MSSNSINAWCRRLGRMVLESMPLCFLFALLNPVLIVLQDSTYSLSLRAWLFLIALSVFASSGVGLFLSLIPQKRKKSVTLVLRAFFLTFFLITIFYPYGGSLQDGSVEVYPAWSELLSLYAVYFLLFVAVLWLEHRYFAALQRIYMLSILLALAVTSYGAYDSIKRIKEFVEFRPLDDSVDLTFAKSKNIIVILGDMLQGTTVEQALNLHPELKGTFSGFTFYTRAVSPFPFTNYSLPALLMGKTYAQNTKEPLKFADNLALAQRDSFITDARQKGYDSVVVGALVPAADRAFSLMPPNKSLGFSFICNHVDLGIVRVFKRRILEGLFTDARLTSDIVLLKLASYQFLEKLIYTAIGSASNKLFFLHNYMPHSPVASFKEGIEPRIIAAPSDAEYLEEAAYFLNTIGALFEHLKRIGIYDNALIIVVGDHGHFAGYSKSLYTSFPGAGDFKGYESGPWARAVCMYNPALLIKPPKAAGGALISHEPASLTHVRPIVDAVLKQPTVSVTDIISENLRHNQGMDIIVFGKRTQASPYISSKSHVALQLQGSATELAQLFLRGDRFHYAYPRYALGTTAKVTKGNRFLEGTWLQEDKGAWLRGGTAYMSLSLENAQTTGDCVLTLGAVPLVSDSHPYQRIRVRANGQELGVMIFHKAEEQSVILPGSIVRKSSNKLRLDLEPLDAVSPKALQKWDFGEPLSIFLHSYSISK